MAVLIVGDRDGAVDVVHDALARVQPGWNGRSRDDRVALSYVRRVMLSIAIDAARRRQRMRARAPLLFERDSGSDPDIAQRVAVWREVVALPPQQRAVVALHYYNDLTVAVGAELLGCSESTFLTHLRRARKTLAERLGQGEAATSERGRER
ncbi:MAG: sigma factor-like helix-turn-helix DNA-binding protein [Mycobacteriales bacterium]